LFRFPLKKTGVSQTITVEQSYWEGELQTPKTKNAYRPVDLCSSLAALLKAFAAEPRTGLLFTNRIGNPLSQTNVLPRSLHPILEELKVEKTGFAEKVGTGFDVPTTLRPMRPKKSKEKQIGGCGVS
jgi:hypothetical protein